MDRNRLLTWTLWAPSTLLMAGLLSGCSPAAWDMDGPMSFFQPQGTLAAIQLDVLMVALWVCIGIFFVTGGLYFYTLIRYRSRPGDEARIPAQLHGSTAIEIGLVAIFVVLLTIIMVPNVRALFIMDDLDTIERAELVVDVKGYQWWWGFEYPAQGIRTANELHIPVGTKVTLNLTSDNVIHSFWVPKVAGKLDVIPNQLNRMWFEADTVGVFQGQCAELCGASHANMRFLLVVHEQADFDAWVEAQARPARPVTEGVDPAQVALIERGRAIFLQNACIGCHTVSGTHALGQAGPDLSHFGSRREIAAGMWGNTHTALAAWVQHPADLKEGSLMPNLGLSDDDAAAIAAYLLSLK
jgi:cytochrome c oxidase subunit 2